ncbi:MAG: hypothetical protein LBI53_08115 [Candidatus Peribacteria bacterium]|jgi:methylthioribose-1-phosphate isomerase|nr:hypothetical protein [Candidatus Peribacteria bacterium]
MADLKRVEQIVQDIYDIKIQGATNIAKSAFRILVDELKRQKFSSCVEVREFMLPAMMMLEKARPTEPMMFNGMAYITDKLDAYKDSDVNKFLQIAQDTSQTY